MDFLYIYKYVLNMLYEVTDNDGPSIHSHCNCDLFFSHTISLCTAVTMLVKTCTTAWKPEPNNESLRTEQAYRIK